MSLTRTDIDKIAHLARLELTEAEIPVYVDSLSRIIDFVGELDRADTQGIAPMAHPLPGLAQRLRPDRCSKPTSASATSATRRRSRLAST